MERGSSVSEDGLPALPLVKEKFTSERRKAKVMNFSIAYGKTAFGLAKDWNVSLQEAEETVERWYSDRWEVREWQEQTIKRGRVDGYVTTLLGRRRNIPDLRSRHKKFRLATIFWTLCSNNALECLQFCKAPVCAREMHIY